LRDSRPASAPEAPVGPRASRIDPLTVTRRHGGQHTTGANRVVRRRRRQRSTRPAGPCPSRRGGNSRRRSTAGPRVTASRTRPRSSAANARRVRVAPRRRRPSPTEPSDEVPANRRSRRPDLRSTYSQAPVGSSSLGLVRDWRAVGISNDGSASRMREYCGRCCGTPGVLRKSAAQRRVRARESDWIAPRRSRVRVPLAP
jgi:hypothetical protein